MFIRTGWRVEEFDRLTAGAPGSWVGKTVEVTVDARFGTLKARVDEVRVLKDGAFVEFTLDVPGLSIEYLP